MNPADSSPEAPFWLEINGRRRTCWTCTPTAVEALVLGYLRTSGYIAGRADLLSLHQVNEPAGCVGVQASVPELNAARVAQEQKLVREHGCGVLHFVTCEPTALRYRQPPVQPAAEVLRDAFRTLFARSDAAYPDGGMHAAGIVTGDALRHVALDVGRHNAVDRVIGLAMQADVELARAGLILSARVSGAMALKAARAGIGWVASRSIPTSLARQLADAVGLPLIARAGRGLARESGA